MKRVAYSPHIFIVCATFVFCSFVWVFLNSNIRNSWELNKKDSAHAACDTSFFSVSEPTFSKGCLVPNQQIYLNDSRYTFFQPPGAPNNPIVTLNNVAYLQTTNVGIKDQANLSWLITFNRSSTIYLFTRHIPGVGVPSWISNTYERLTDDVLSNLPQYLMRKNTDGLIGLYDVWKKTEAIGAEKFYAAGDSNNPAYSMYIVAVLPNGLGSASPTSTVRPTATVRPTVTPSPSPYPTLTPPPLGGPISATVETQPVPHSGDAADDPAIWVNKLNRALSTVIGTDKLGGLAVYGMDGKQIQYLPDGQMNNVDLRDGFSLGGQLVTLVTAGNRSNNTIGIYKINPTTRLLENVAARAITTTSVYGSTMYHDLSANKFYYYINSKSGAIQQWELFDNGAGKVDARLVRSLKVPSQPEGCVADDELGFFYIGEEAKGIWKFSASATGSTTGSIIAPVGQNGLTSNVEGLAIAKSGTTTGYLLASSQGSSSYNVYRREGNNAFVKGFKIVDGNGIDGTSDTDGIDAVSENLGPAFPNGMFVAQDGSNTGGNQNYKYVPWQVLGL